MDGITSSSLGGRAPLSLNTLASQSGPAGLMTLHASALSVTVNISLAGDEFSRKVHSQAGRLAQIDPKLAEQYRAVVDLLNQTDPKAAKHFLNFIDRMLENADIPEAEPLSVSQALPEGVQLDLSISAHVEQLVAQVQGNSISVTQQSVDLHLELHVGSAPQKKADPVVLDLNGDGVQTSGIAHGVSFDLEATSVATQVSFVQGDDALLALDRNGNGIIDDGRELFGTQHGAANGFEELKKFDDNEDGVIDVHDTAFSQLQGVLRRGRGLETATLAQLGVKSILTAYQDQYRVLASGDDILQVGTFRRGDGSTGQAYNLGLSLRA